MLTTDFVAGAPCWIDLGVADVTGTARFYEAVLGWRHVRSDSGDYDGFELDGKSVGAVWPLTERGTPSAWLTYFRVSDVDATAETVRRLGGTVRVAPVDIQGLGRMAQLSDPFGGLFALWKSDETPGMEVTDQPGALGWIELMTPDVIGAKRFYTGVFGWQTQDTAMPDSADQNYTLLTPAELGPERMFGGMVALPTDQLPAGRPYWHPVFTVRDCDDVVARITGNGGTIQMGPENVPDVGRLAVALDPEGAEFVVLAPAESG